MDALTQYWHPLVHPDRDAAAKYWKERAAQAERRCQYELEQAEGLRAEVTRLRLLMGHMLKDASSEIARLQHAVVWSCGLHQWQSIGSVMMSNGSGQLALARCTSCYVTTSWSEE